MKTAPASDDDDDTYISPSTSSSPSTDAAMSPTSSGRAPDRSYNIVLSPRGLGALEGAGVTLPEDSINRLQGNVRHLNGAGSFSGQFKGTVAVNRATLADAIVAAAVAKHPPGDESGGESRGSGGGGGSVEFLYGRGRVRPFTHDTISLQF